MKIFIPGGAGLVGLNLIYLLSKSHPEWEILVVDKNKSSINIAKKLFKRVNFICEDLTNCKNSKWSGIIKNFDVCIMLKTFLVVFKGVGVSAGESEIMPEFMGNEDGNNK